MYSASEIRTRGEKRLAHQRLVKAVENKEHPNLKHWIEQRFPHIMALCERNAGTSGSVVIEDQMPEAIIDALSLLGFSAYCYEKEGRWYSKVGW